MKNFALSMQKAVCRMQILLRNIYAAYRLPPTAYHIRGFTLLETLIAVSILALAVSGPLFAASRAIVAAQTARDQLTASYLAQEGVEYVRAMRDNIYLTYYRASGSNISDDAWTDFISGSSAGSITSCKATTCTLDPQRTMGTGSNLALTTCSAGSCGPLYLSSGLYTQQAVGTLTPFTRTIQVTEVSSTEARVVSSVTWTFHGRSYTVSVRDNLTGWQ